MASSGGSPVQSKVLPPAIALMVVGGLNVLGALYFIGNGLYASMRSGQIIPPDAKLSKAEAESIGNLMAMGGTFNVIVGILALLLAGLIFFGGLKMKNLQSYGLAMTSSILAMIPFCSPSACCVLGIGIGIWALVILLQADVKAAFH